MDQNVLAVADAQLTHIDPNLLDPDFDAFDNLDGQSIDDFIADFGSSDDDEATAVTQSESDFNGESPSPSIH